MSYSKYIKPIFAMTLLASFATASFADFVVVANKASGVTSLSKRQVGELFLGKTVTGLSQLQPVDQDASSAIYKDFYQNILDRSPGDMSSYWAGVVFSGDGTKPVAADSDAQAIATVVANKTAISYVDPKDISPQQMTSLTVVYPSHNASDSSDTAKVSQHDAPAKKRVFAHVHAVPLHEIHERAVKVVRARYKPAPISSAPTHAHTKAAPKQVAPVQIIAQPKPVVAQNPIVTIDADNSAAQQPASAPAGPSSANDSSSDNFDQQLSKLAAEAAQATSQLQQRTGEAPGKP